MRFALCFFALLSVTSGWGSGQEQTGGSDGYQGYYCPQTHALKISPSEQYWLQGTIGGKHARMYLNRGGDGVVGVFYYTSDWLPILLGGLWKDGGRIFATDVPRTHDALPVVDTATAPLKGRLVDGKFVGSLTSAGGGQQPVHLIAMSQPRCETGPWRQFEDPGWPVGFSYPPCWHVQATGDEIDLTSPDPMRMAYLGPDITVSKGGMADIKKTGLVMCGQEWKYGYSCDSESDESCTRPAKSPQQGGITVIDISQHEWRTYCIDGGYQGQAEGVDRVLLLGNTWVEVSGENSDVVTRIVDSATRR